MCVHSGRPLGSLRDASALPNEGKGIGCSLQGSAGGIPVSTSFHFHFYSRMWWGLGQCIVHRWVKPEGTDAVRIVATVSLSFKVVLGFSFMLHLRWVYRWARGAGTNMNRYSSFIFIHVVGSEAMQHSGVLSLERLDLKVSRTAETSCCDTKCQCD